MATQNITNGWEQIITAPNTSTSVQFTSIPLNINNLLVLFYNVVSTAADNCHFQFSTNSGSTYITTGYNSANSYYGSSSSVQTQTGGVIFGTLNAANRVQSGYMYVSGLNLSGVYPSISGQTAGATGGNFMISFQGALTTATPPNVNSFRLFGSGVGTWSGTFKLYALN